LLHFICPSPHASLPHHPDPFPTRRSSDLDRQRAEDIVQETLLRAWRNAHKLSSSGVASVRPWLVTVARRIAIDQHRSERARPSRSEEHTSELQSRENLVCRLLLDKKNRAP